MSEYWRPIAMTDPARPLGAHDLAGGWCWFDQVERLKRGAPPLILPAASAPPEVLEALSAPRPAVAGLSMDQPRIMGIVNVTPDSFSDGGRFDGAGDAALAARAMLEDGADILDIGGESTRPGAAEVPVDAEIARVEPVVRAVANLAPVSVDTRKAAVARAALGAGAAIVNDVSALQFDTGMGPAVAAAGVPVCLMHAQGSPETMQDDPSYGDVLLDVFDGLADAVARAEGFGIRRADIIVDPGIGFGKTLDHNIALLRRLSLFHGLGVPVLLGASRKRFVGTITGAEPAERRLAGSLAVALSAYSQGVQVLRVHDIKETKEAALMAQVLAGQTQAKSR